MGLEVISNTAGVYKEVPNEVIQKPESKVPDVTFSNGTQNIQHTETKAVTYSDNDGSGQGSTNYGTGKEEKAAESENERKQQIMSAISSANSKIKMVRTHCEFVYHEESKRISIKIKDDKTGEIVKEIPPEDTLEMLGKMWDLAGLFVDDKR